MLQSGHLPRLVGREAPVARPPAAAAPRAVESGQSRDIRKERFLGLPPNISERLMRPGREKNRLICCHAIWLTTQQKNSADYPKAIEDDAAGRFLEIYIPESH